MEAMAERTCQAKVRVLGEPKFIRPPEGQGTLSIRIRAHSLAVTANM